MTPMPSSSVVALPVVAAAIAVAKAGLKTIHLAPAGPPDRRTSALMMPERRLPAAAPA